MTFKVTLSYDINVEADTFEKAVDKVLEGSVDVACATKLNPQILCVEQIHDQ